MGVTDKQRKDGLLTHRIELIKRLEIFDSLLLDEMMANKVLNEQQSEAIKGRGEGLKDNFKANIKLIDDVLARCDLEKYNIFLNLLKERQEDLANKLRGNQDAATTRAPAAFTISDAAMEVPDTVNRGKYEELQREAKTDENFMYKMDIWKGKPRGMALIINVQHKGQECERHGTDVDRDNLFNLWKYFMRFKVTTYNDEDDLTAQGIMSKVKKFSKDPQLKESQAIVVCLLAHGKAEHIQGTDLKLVSLEEIYLCFSNANIQQRVPRLFFIQACRGRTDKGEDRTDACPAEDEDEDDTGDTGITISDAIMTETTLADCFWGYATPHGRPAYRNEGTGSWYITALVKIFYDHAHERDLAAMHNLVNNAVSEESNKHHGAKTISEYKPRLTKAYLYFFP